MHDCLFLVISLDNANDNQQFLLDDFFGRVDAFMNSDQNRAASKLLSAYTDGDVEEIKRAAQSSIISNLDHVVSLLIHVQPSGVASLYCNEIVI